MDQDEFVRRFGNELWRLSGDHVVSRQAFTRYVHLAARHYWNAPELRFDPEECARHDHALDDFPFRPSPSASQ